MSTFDFILLGHLIGDYLFQNKWMAMNKNASHFKCFVHCIIYTLTLCVVTLPVIKNWWWPFIVFASHYPIDRWGLADRWMLFIKGRSLADYMENGHKDIPFEKWNIKAENYHVLRGGFTAVVYTVVDNTMHLVLMLLGWWLIK
jgi:hypothetical protein